MKKSKQSKGITLIALVITIIVLLILAGITISLTVGQRGILERAGEAGRNYQEAEKQEGKELDKLYSSIKVAEGSQVTLTMEELNTYIQEQIANKSVITLLYEAPEGGATSGKVTFKDGHTTDEFDALRFVYGMYRNGGWDSVNETEVLVDTWNDVSQHGNGCNYLIGLYGYYDDGVNLYELSKTGFTIGPRDEYVLFKVYGMKY